MSVDIISCLKRSLRMCKTQEAKEKLLQHIGNLENKAKEGHARCLARGKHSWQKMSGLRGTIKYVQCACCSQATAIPEVWNKRLLQERSKSPVA